MLQGGDCAETFEGATAEAVCAKLQTLLQMALVISPSSLRAAVCDHTTTTPPRAAEIPADVTVQVDPRPAVCARTTRHYPARTSVPDRVPGQRLARGSTDGLPPRWG